MTSAPTTSQSNTWTNQGTTTNWNDGGNWSSGAPPGANDIAWFTGEDVSVTGTATVGALDMAGAQMASFAMDLSVLGVAGQTYAMNLTDSAQVTFEPQSLLTAPSVGIGSEGLGSVLTMVQSDATVGKTVLGTQANGNGGLDITDGSLWSTTGGFFVGGAAGATGDLSVSAGGVLYVGKLFGHHANMYIGTDRGSLGAVDVSDGAITSFGDIIVGGDAGQTGHGVGDVNVGADGGFGSYNGTVQVNGGSIISMADGRVEANTINIAAGATMLGSGLISTGMLQDNGVIEASGTMYLDPEVLSGNGVIDILGGATLNLFSYEFPATGGIVFAGTDATLNLEFGIPEGMPIADFAPGDSIGIQGNANISKISFDQSTDTLKLSNGTGTSFTLQFAGNYAGDSFHLGHGTGEALITLKA